MAKSSNKFNAFCLIFYYWLKAILLFFIPKNFRSKSVENELVLITGGGSGLGRALAIRFARLGANVVVWDINQLGLEETIRQLTEANPAIIAKAYVCDITDRNAVYETAAKVRLEIGSISVLVNNAGVVNGKTLLDITDEKIVQTFNVNAISHFWTVKAVLPDMIRWNSGHLVSIASLAGYIGGNQMTDYCASKSAVIGFEESLRLELLNAGLTGIKSTIVCPYFINTGMFSGIKSYILPELNTADVADRIIAAVLCEDQLVVIPMAYNLLITLKSILPIKAYNKLYEAFGGFEVMTDFTGRDNNINTNTENRKIK